MSPTSFDNFEKTGIILWLEAQKSQITSFIMDKYDIKFLEKFSKQYEIEPNRYSCLIIALRDARMITGRDRETGQFKADILESSNSIMNPYSFIGVINYLLILEIIGAVYSSDSYPTRKETRFTKL